MCKMQLITLTLLRPDMKTIHQQLISDRVVITTCSGFLYQKQTSSFVTSCLTTE